jgi:hypothetical protein
LLVACDGQTLDAGSDVPHGLLPVDERNPILLTNDGIGDWYGVYAILFANSGGPPLAGIAINTSSYATNLNDNLAAWRELVAAGRASGLRGIPDPVASVGAPLERPLSGEIEQTIPNDSQGARLIVDLSSSSSSPRRPLVVVAGGRLTDIADAYLLDPTVSSRIVVVAALGSGSANGGAMGAPNGELDPWADWIVTERFRYVQVSAFYDGRTDLRTSQLADLPVNPLTDLVVAHQPNITPNPTRADHVSVLAVALPSFVVAVERVEPDPAATFDGATGPDLVPSENGQHWLVTAVDPAAASVRLQRMLTDPNTFGR